jgi:hypothetical protein
VDVFFNNRLGAFEFDNVASATGTFNAGSTLDLVTADGVSNTVSLYIGNSDGTYKARTSYNIGGEASDVYVNDVDGDGNNDIVATNKTTGELTVLFGNGGGGFVDDIGLGDGTFKARVCYTQAGSPNDVVLHDFNGDGNLDVFSSFGAYVGISLGNGDGTLRAVSTSPLYGGSSSLSLGDMNGDDVLDSGDLLEDDWEIVE